MFSISLKLIVAKKLMDFFNSKDTVKQPADKGIKKLAMSAKAELIKATVVDEGIAAGNIASTPIQYAPFQAIVTHGTGPGHSYIPYLETGTVKMGARHREGSRKIIGEGEGMFSYVKKWLAGKMSEATEHIAGDIEKRFKK